MGEPDREVPEGYELVTVEAANWRIDPGRPCRRMLTHWTYCRQPSVIAINRGRSGRPSWWAYCPEHSYGKWAEDGKVMMQILRAKPDD